MLTPHPSLVKNNDSANFDESISVVIPTFNEAGNIVPLMERLLPVMREIDIPFEIIFVDDGSKDQTAQQIADYATKNHAVKLVRLSRNFGKEAALSAGLAHACGDAVIQLDADLQHPPEVLSDFVQEWRNGGQIVYGARQSRQSESFFRRILAKSFYSVFSTISDVKLMEGLGDFLLIDRKVVDAMLSLPERERFTKGLYAWVGFERIAVPFEVAPRANGVSGWSIFKLFHFGINAITSFGSVPLKVWSYIGLLMSASSVTYASVILLQRLIYGTNVPGYPSLMVSICFFAGVQLLGLGIVGEYLSRVLAEVKQRPLYLVREKVGFDMTSISEEKPKKVSRMAF